jgi:hypothetical protein
MGYVVRQLASHPSCPETRHFPSLVCNSHPPCVENGSISRRYRDLSGRQPPLSTLPSQSAPNTLRSLPRFPLWPLIHETISTTFHQNLLRSFNASTAFKCGHPHVWLFRPLLVERRCSHSRPQWDLTSPYQTTRALEKRRCRRLHQRTKTVRTKAPAPLPQRPTPLPQRPTPLPQRPTPLPNHSLNSLDSTVMQLLHPLHPLVATRIRRLARRDLQRDFSLLHHHHHGCL